MYLPLKRWTMRTIASRGLSGHTLPTSNPDAEASAVPPLLLPPLAPLEPLPPPSLPLLLLLLLLSARPPLTWSDDSDISDAVCAFNW
jgi:hypothetical protein